MSRFAAQLLASQQGIIERHGLLNLPHMDALVKFRDDLKDDSDSHVPHFDPLDGGTRSRCLLLLDAPGRRAAYSGSTSVQGTGFVSRDNPDPSANNLRAALNLEGLPREETIIWNAVPWYIGTAAKLDETRARNWNAAKPWLARLITVLPALEVVVLMGRKAERAEALIQSAFPRLTVFKCPHPGGQAYNHERYRTKTHAELKNAAVHLEYR
jgi:hypothetical protein